MHAVSYPPPSDLRLIEASSSQLIFQWAPSAASLICHSLYYRITAENCGLCPVTTHHTTATCTGIHPATYHQCSFGVQTVVCDDVTGNASTVVSASLRGQTPSYCHL